MKSTRPVESLSDEQPQLNPALRKLAAILCQCFHFGHSAHFMLHITITN